MEVRDRILIIEDDRSIRKFFRTILEANRYDVISADTGEEGYSLITSQCPDLVILDLGLPDIDGMEILSRLRKWSGMPVVVISARSHEKDKVEALDLGADDYITKPFSLKNLSARVQAVLRRSTEDLVPLARQFSWNQGDLVIDYDRKEVRKKGEPVALTAIEWKLLAAFTKYPQKIFTRENLIELVFGLDFSGYDRVIDTHIKNLRKKIEDDSKQPVYLCTVYGMGYKFGGTAE